MVQFSVTGAQLRVMFAFQGEKTREFCQVSGLVYSYDRAKAADQALTITVGGTPVDTAKTYRIATNSYVGGHLHDFFNLPEAGIPVTPLMPQVSDRDIFIEAVRAQKKVRSSIEGRITIARGENK